jgi:Family of unknown function (DUF5683)
MSGGYINCKACFLLVLALVFAVSVVAQEPKLKTDSLAKDTSFWIHGSPKELPKLNTNNLKFKPEPKKAVLYSLIFPGLGQIYNRKYWKLPLVYGGFIGLTYAVSWNSQYYSDYSRAFKDIMSSDPYTNTSWFSFVKTKYSSVTDVTSSEITSLKTSFRNRKNYYRRYRDLSIIGMVGLYAICAIDAYIDAQLFDFDISDNLSMRVEPAVISSQPARVAETALGVNCSIKF